MILSTPTFLKLPPEARAPEVAKFLAYYDRSVEYMLMKVNKNKRWMQSDPEGWSSRVAQLKADRNKTALKVAGESLCTYAGLWHALKDRFGWDLRNEVSYPEPRLQPWAVVPEHPARYYQALAVDALIAARHGAIELPTGAGKSRVLLEAAKRLGLRTVIVTPRRAITLQIYKDFAKYLGKQRVGMFGDGKKDFRKQFVVATAQSLAAIQPGSEAWDELSKTEVLAFDESHTCPAETFETVCLGLLGNAPYRFFVSATQMRQDGSELVLQGITGPIVYRKSYQELVQEGFLAQLVFKTFGVRATAGANASDVHRETRAQLFCNANVCRAAGSIATKMVELAGRQTLILIDEFSQFEALRPHLKTPFRYVHGGASKDAKEFLPKEYWESDDEAIDAFNRGECRLLVGTTAVSTGVDLKPTGCIVYLQGGAAEISIRQALGRGTRVVPGKKDCWVVDFKVNGSKKMEKHFQSRKEIYEALGPVQHHELP